MSNNSIWPIDKTLSGANSCGQSVPGSNGNERVLHIPQSSGISRASDCLMSNPGNLLMGSFPYAKMQSVYSVTPADWLNMFFLFFLLNSKSIIVLVYACVSNVTYGEPRIQLKLWMNRIIS